MNVFEQLEQMKKDALEQINACDQIVVLNKVKTDYLGKKGPMAQIMQEMRNLSSEERPKLGAVSNEVKKKIEEAYVIKLKELEEKAINDAINNDAIDVTLPGRRISVGSTHPLTKIINELEDLFVGMGYQIAEGPEVEKDLYNFELLNLPKDHPARDMQDSFYIDPTTLLRTHTSPVQARVMLASEGKPIKIACPGKVYRRDSDDATHSHQFMQCEGLVLGENITLADLKGTLLMMARKIFGEDREIRLRPSFFPFTEPSVEVDVSCMKCGGKGCNICKGNGWIEVLGSGMVNNNVLEMCGYDSTKIQGFAFGVGVERLAMLKYGIDDIRNFYINDLRFLDQYKEVK